MAYRSPNTAHFAAKTIAVTIDSYLLLRERNHYIETANDKSSKHYQRELPVPYLE